MRTSYAVDRLHPCGGTDSAYHAIRGGSIFAVYTMQEKQQQRTVLKTLIKKTLLYFKFLKDKNLSVPYRVRARCHVIRKRVRVGPQRVAPIRRRSTPILGRHSSRRCVSCCTDCGYRSSRTLRDASRVAVHGSVGATPVLVPGWWLRVFRVLDSRSVGTGGWIRAAPPA